MQLAKREGRNNFSALRIISLEVVDYETIKVSRFQNYFRLIYPLFYLEDRFLGENNKKQG